MTDEAILDKALATIVDEAAGNLADDDAPELVSQGLEWCTFGRTVVCETGARVDSSMRVGSAGKGVYGSPAAAEEAAESYAQDLMTDSGVVPMVMNVLAARDDRGFDIRRPPDVEATARTFSGEEACSDCGGQGRTECRSCYGSGRTGCLACNGGGKKSCLQCNGMGTTLVWDAYEKRDVRRHCYGCTGSGRVSCGQCNGSGKTSCTSCSGSGKIGCRPCEGGGVFTHSFVAVLSGELSAEIEWRDVPDAARAALRDTGLSRLGYGQAEIESLGSEATDRRHGEARFEVRVPVGELVVEASGETFEFDVVGKDALVRARRPFAERLAEGGIEALRAATQVRGSEALDRLRDAMRFDLVRAAVYAAHWWPVDEATQALREVYPTIEPEAARQRLAEARAANTRALSYLARGIRRRTYGFFVAPLVFAWFTLGLRRIDMVDRTLGWVDGLPVLLVAGIAWFWMRRRITRAARKLGFEARGDEDLPWSDYRRAPNHTAAPFPWFVIVLLFALALSAVSLEIGHGLALYEIGWAEWRSPWGPHLDGFWGVCRDALAPVLEPLRSLIASIEPWWRE